jgi:23S rRNA (guanosine2251-2'-O)-methyltransferase
LLIAEGIDRDERVTEIERLARDAGARVINVPRSELDSRCVGHHQGVALDASSFPYVDAPELGELAARGELILALDGIVDPRNVGALLRTAEATGFRHVVAPHDRAAGITPIVVNASAGAAEHLLVWQEVNLARWLKSAQVAGFWVAGLVLDPMSTQLFDIDLRPPLVLVVGAEGAGLRRLIREACDVLVSIPMYGQVASLNASVAGALAMYEVRRWLETDGESGDSDTR